MKKDDKTFTDILLENNRYLFLKEYLEKNKSEILKALNLKASNKAIFETIKIKTDLNIDYRQFLNILSKFKEKYIYNLTEEEYKKQLQTISQAGITTQEKKVEIEQPEILAAKISESEQPAQPKEQEKVETKKDVPADANPSGKIPKWKEAGFNSSYEYFNYMKSRPSSEKITQSETNTEYNNGYKWEPSIKK